MSSAASDADARHACQTLVATSPCGAHVARAGVDANVRRWDPVEQNAFADDRRWTRVDAFARALVRGEARLGDLGRGVAEASVSGVPASENDADGGRRTFAFRCRYRGTAFSGYAWHGASDAMDAEWTYGNGSVSAALQRALRSVTDKATRPTPSAGRTDRGVSAAASCVSFWTKRQDVTSEDIERLVNEESAPGRAGVLHISETRVVPRSFHATFAAKRRRYVYLLPKRQAFRETRTPRAELDAATMNRILQPLAQMEGAIDMYAYARGTPPGRSSEVNFHVARAFEARLPEARGDAAIDDDVAAGLRRSRGRERAQSEASSHTNDVDDDDDADDGEVIVIELEADRFLRKLVRCLVATAAREAAGPPASDDALVRIALARDRRLAAPPAPALGLIFASVSYED